MRSVCYGGLSRDEVVQIYRLSGCEKFVCKRKRRLYLVCSFVLSYYRDLRIGRCDMRGFEGFTVARVFWRIR